jgi:hypothetical protein
MRNVFAFLRNTAGTLLFLSALLSVAQTPIRRFAAQPSASEPQVALQNSVTERLASSTNLGHLSSATRLDGMSLILKRTATQEADLDQLLYNQQDPGSPSYHQWLTPQMFGDRFGVAQADIDVIVTWLQSHGFFVVETAPSRNRIAFSGSSAQVEATFGLTMVRYQRDGQDFFENSTPVRLPQSLAAVVSGITGLSSYHMQGHAVSRQRSGVAPDFTTTSGSHFMVPWDFRQIYDMNPLINAGSDGTGIKIGVVGQSAFDTNQIANFQMKTGQAAKQPTAVLVPNTGVSNRVQGDEDESELDLEYSSGSAPGASVQFIYTGCGTTASTNAITGTNCQNDGVNTALIYAITNNLAPILTMSYGDCEATIASYANTTLEPILKQANAQGQTVLVSSGDTGAATCDQGTGARAATHGLSVSYPASSVYVTAVGGTLISFTSFASSNNSYGGSATAYTDEQAWNENGVNQGGLAATGGGVSKIFAKPSWQVGSQVPSDGFRDVPDVAFNSSVFNIPYFACTGEATCQANSTLGGTSAAANGGLYGGTSLAAPNFAAMLAVIEQKNASGPLGNINPELYALAEGTANGYTPALHDVVGSGNTVPCVLGTPDCGEDNTTDSIGYNSAYGYDQATGLGSVSATGLAAALLMTTPPVSLALSSNSPMVNQPVTFTATVLGHPTPTGTVTFSVFSSDNNPPITLTNGTATYNYAGFPGLGPYQLTASYSGDGTYGPSKSMVIVKASQVPATLMVASSAGNPLQNSTATTFNITASGQYGTPTGYVLLMVDGVYVANRNSPIPLVNGAATYTYAGFASAGIHTVTATYESGSDYDIYNPPPAGGPYHPQTAYEGGQNTLNLQVSANSQTLTPVVTLSGAPTAALAPTDQFQVTALVAKSGTTAPTGSFTYVVDGVSGGPLPGVSTANGLSFALGVRPPSGFTPGTHTVQITYAGDNNYKPSVPVSATFTVVLPTFTLSASPSSLTLTSGGRGSLQLTVNAGATYSGTTNFQLGLISYTGAPFSGCFGLSSSSISSQRGAASSVTLTMYSGTSQCTTSNHLGAPAAGNAEETTTNNLLPVILASLGFAGCLAFRRRKIAMRFLLALLTVGLITAVGCTGNGSGAVSTGTTTTTATPTTTGTYVIQVTGIQSGNYTVAASTNFTLVVQ